MADIIKWPVILVCPGEEELPLLAELSSRRDARIVAVADPSGDSIGAGLAEVMGMKVVRDLSEVQLDTVRYLVHPPLDDQVSPLVDQARQFGLEVMSCREFSNHISGPRLAPSNAPPTPKAQVELGADSPPPTTAHVRDTKTDYDFLEMETAAIHRTLSRIEEALDREALLRWLLGLATRATGAASGSIMLFDRHAEELYIAFAFGLSQHTMHQTRLRMGEGIAGKVAANRRAEFITENRHPGSRRDRSSIKTAISAPILWEGKVLGVLNVSTNDGEGPLHPNALITIESLTHRFGLILDRFLGIQSMRDGEVFRDMEGKFTRDTGQPDSVGDTLAAWAKDLQDAAGADHVSLEVLTSDGDLFTASPRGTGYESPPRPEKAEVLSSGRPMVIRPGDHKDIDPTAVLDEATVFYLPVGREPLRALMSLAFSSPAKAHHFHSVSSEILYLVNRHLTDYLDRSATADQVDRLTTLATALSEMASTLPRDKETDRVLTAACRLTGADRALLLTGVNDVHIDSEQDGQGESVQVDEKESSLRQEAVRLLTDAEKSGWQTTLMETSDGPSEGGSSRTILVVPLDAKNPFPGLVLLDKRRLHPLDGASFTEFDALFARRLLPLLSNQIEKPPVVGAGDTSNMLGKLDPVQSVPAKVSSLTRETLAEILRREMDRCDRYHTMLGLTAFRIGDELSGSVNVPGMVAEIGRRLRSSDHVGCLEDGTLLIIVPEDIQSLPRLRKRVFDVVTQLTGKDDLSIEAASRVYPGGSDTPEELIESVLGALPS